MPTHKLQSTVTSTSGVQSISGYDSETGAAEITNMPTGQAFSANTTNASVAGIASLNAAKLQDVFILASQPCTIYTNGTNSTTIPLLANVPLLWGTSMPVNSFYSSNPFAGTVNSATLTCNTATILWFQIGTN